MEMTPTGPDFAEILGLAMALPFIPVGVAALLPQAASLLSVAAWFMLV